MDEYQSTSQRIAWNFFLMYKQNVKFHEYSFFSLYQNDKQFLKTLFSQILEDEVEEEKQRDLVLFLKEFCMFSQSLQPNCKDLFFKTLVNYGVLGAIEIVLVSSTALSALQYAHLRF